MWFVRAGTQIKGPFSEDQLRSMRRRGEFSPIHQISTDRIRWDSAAQLVQLLDGPLPDWQIHRQPLVSTADRIQDVTDESRSEPSSTASEWCYVDSAHQQVGPVPEQVIRELLQTKQLSRKSLVFKLGGTQWEQVSQHPELARFARSGSSGLLAIVASAALVIVMLGTLLYVLLSRKSVLGDWTSEAPRGKAPSSSNPIQFGNDDDKVIQSISDEEHLKKAVGLVVCGWTISLNDGNRGDETESTGTCFSVSSSGHLVTNKHVVESAEKRQRMAKAFVLKDYAFALVMPKARTLVRSEIEKGTINPPPRDDEQFEKMSRAVAEKN